MHPSDFFSTIPWIFHAPENPLSKPQFHLRGKLFWKLQRFIDLRLWASSTPELLPVPCLLFRITLSRLGNRRSKSGSKINLLLASCWTSAFLYDQIVSVFVASTSYVGVVSNENRNSVSISISCRCSSPLLGMETVPISKPTLSFPLLALLVFLRSRLASLFSFADFPSF